MTKSQMFPLQLSPTQSIRIWLHDLPSFFFLHSPLPSFLHSFFHGHFSIFPCNTSFLDQVNFSVSAFSFSIILVQFSIFVVYLTRQTWVKIKKKTFKPSVLLIRIICRHRLLHVTLLGIFRLSSSQKVKSNPLQC